MLKRLLGSGSKVRRSRTRSRSKSRPRVGAKSKAKTGVRTFKVVNAVNTDGCPTKFKPGRYTGNPQSAANKSFTRLCNLKNVKGKCTLYVTVQETTQGSGKVATENDNNNGVKKGNVVKKQSSYMVERVKLAKPLVMFAGTDKEFKRLYATKSKSVSSIPKCNVNRPRTAGPMKSKSRRAERNEKNKKKKVSGKKNNSMNGGSKRRRRSSRK